VGKVERNRKILEITFHISEVSMRKAIILLSLLFPILSQAAGETGLGVILGTPNGITAKHWISENAALDANLGWSISGSKFQLNANYIFVKPEAFEISEELFDFFFGAGLSLRTKSGKQDGEVVLGPRLPLGVSYQFAKPDMELFLQAALNVGIVPSSDIYADANLGVRFFF